MSRVWTQRLIRRSRTRRRVVIGSAILCGPPAAQLVPVHRPAGLGKIAKALCAVYTAAIEDAATVFIRAVAGLDHDDLMEERVERVEGAIST